MTKDEFESALSEDLGWRKQEISSLYNVAQRYAESNKVIFKTVILLVYAHWEGYIKKSSKLYLKYISDKNVKISELNENFKAITLKKIITQCVKNSGRGVEKEIEFIKKLDRIEKRKFKVDIDINDDFDDDIIDTAHNLKPKVLKDIISVIGIPYYSALETREQYLNKYLLESRNIISHGSRLVLDEDNEFDLCNNDVRKLKDVILTFLDMFFKVLCQYVVEDYFLAKNMHSKNRYDLDVGEELSDKLCQIERRYENMDDSI